MPKRIFTQDDIERKLQEARVNRKRSGGYDEVTKRLEKIAQEKANRNNPTPNTDNDELTVMPNNTVIVSNNENIETEVTIDGSREYYDQQSYEDTFDTEVVQLVTAEPEEEPEVEAPPEPPPAPNDIRINCLNHHWTLNGRKGRTEKDKPSWHHNHHPLGNNPGGGYLVIPDDHPLFYLRTCEPKKARKTFNFEWKVDGEVVSNEAAFHMYNCSDQKPEDDNFRKADDIIVEVRVWNESGEMKAKVPYRCAKNIGDSDHIDSATGERMPRWKWKGTRYFDEEKFFDGHWKCYTEYKLDPRYRARTHKIKYLIFDKYDSDVRTLPTKFRAKPNSKLQLITSLSILPDAWNKVHRAVSNIRVNGRLTSRNLHIHHHIVKVMHHVSSTKIKAAKEKFKKEFLKYNRQPFWKRMNPLENKRQLIGEIQVHGKWMSLKEFWSGIPVKDPYDVANFMRFNEDGKLDNKNGQSQMEAHGKYIQVTTTPGKEKKIRFKWGFAYDIKGKNKRYWVYTGEWRVNPDPDEDDVTWHQHKLTPYELDFYGMAEPKPVKQTAHSKFTKSRGKQTLAQKLRTNQKPNKPAGLFGTKPRKGKNKLRRSKHA